MKDPVAERFRFPEVRIVEASAGSGKTYALARRYVQLLLDPALPPFPVPMRNILAITFTNKAAYEMKARILEFLKLIALEKLDASRLEDILGPIGLDGKSASRKAFIVMEELIHNYNFFQVQTIDSFINALLAGCAFKAGLTANFRIRTDSREFLAHSLDELISQAGKDERLQKLFQYFLNNYLFLENRSNWFPKDDILGILKTLFSQFNTFPDGFAESLFSPEDLMTEKRVILEKMRRLRDILPEGTHAGFRKTMVAFLERYTAGFDIDKVSEYFAREEIPVRKGTRVERPVEELWTDIRTRLQDLCHQEALSLFNPYIQIFREVQGLFLRLSSQEDVLFLEELNKRARELFDKNLITVEELYYRLATRFRHYLIDEFQDTSRLQWRNLEGMAEEALSTGGSLFYVGDRKQAIYGFRGGETGLFDDVRARFGAYNVREEKLTDNWRSHQAVVEFNNAVFSGENLRRFIALKDERETESKKKTAVLFSEDDVAEVGKVFASARQTFQPKKTGGYVRVEPVDIEKKEDREEVIREKVLAQIADLRKRFAYRDIAILTRGNTQIQQLTNWLLEAGVPVASERTSDAREHYLLIEIVAFLRFLHSPIDNLAFAQFLTGEIFPRATGLNAEEIHGFLFHLRERLSSEKDLYVYAAFREAYPDVWEGFLDEFFRNVGLFPLYETVVSIYGRYRCLEHFPESQGFLMHFLELIKGEEEDHPDLASFLEYFEGLQGEDAFVHVAGQDAVKVLTIHKSKGLEFPVVILPFLGLDVQVGSRGDDHQQSFVGWPTPDGIRLVRLKDSYYHFSEELYGLYALEHKKVFLSELNSVYVALTRARCELYVYIPRKVGNSVNLAGLLIPPDCYERGTKIDYPAETVQDETLVSVPPAGYRDWLEYLRDEFSGYEALLHRTQRVRGETVHAILAGIGNIQGRSLPDILDAAVAQARSVLTEAADWDSCRKTAEEIVGHPDLRKFFDAGDARVLTERDIVAADGQSRRLDRCLVWKDEVWVVDFKSSAEGAEKYQEQVVGYMRLLKELYPGRKVRGFLVYFDRLRSEEIYG